MASLLHRKPPSLLPFVNLQPLRRHLSSREPNNGGLQQQSSLSSKKPTKTKMAKGIAAIINKKPSWSRELETSLAPLFPSPPSQTTVLQALQLIKSPSKALSFFHWVGSKSGFLHDDRSRFVMLEILGRSRNLNAARNFLFSIVRGPDGDSSGGGVEVPDKFFNSLIRSYGHAGLFQESVKIFEEMKSMGVSPSAITFNCLFSILLKRGRTNMVTSLYDEMLNTYGVSPDTYTFNILIRGFCMNGMVDEGFQFFKEMSQLNVEPDVITYNTLVDGLCRQGKVAIASNVVKGMSKKGKDLNPNIVTYTTLVRGFCSKGETDEALKVVQEMVDQGLRPNHITYNTIVKGLCEVENFDLIKEVLDGGSFVPDTCTFNTLMHAHCSAGNLSEALHVFEKMQELRVQPDSASYSIMIRSLTQEREFERAKKYFDELLEKEILLSDKGCRPVVAAYNPIFEYLCQNGDTMKAEKLFRQLMKRGVQDPPSYGTLIMGHCKEGSFHAGYELLVLMLRRNYLPDFEIYSTLIDGLLHKGDPVLAYNTLEKMLKSSHHPQTSVFHSILSELLKKNHVHESASLVMLMLSKQVRQNVHLATDTVRLLFKCGFRDKAFEVVKLLYKNGFVVEMEKIIGFLCKSKKFIEAHALSIFALETEERVGIDWCESIIRGLCEKRRVSEAFSLFYELVERGQSKQLKCLHELSNALVAKGKNAEAQFVSKRIPSAEVADTG